MSGACRCFKPTFIALCACAAVEGSAMQFQAVYDPSINNDAQAPAIKACINSVLKMYEARFSDNITVKIYFQKGGGLGSSSWGYYYNGSNVAVNALYADAKTPDDMEAVKHLFTQTYGVVAYTSANGRALGLDTGGFMSYGGDGGYDGAVSLNTDICFFDHYRPVPGKFDLFSVAAHEIDEVLGTPSGAGDWLAFMTDLFAYDGHGNRSFNGDTNSHSYFSIDGVKMLIEYNHYHRSGGDWGDWVAHSPSLTQDYAIFSGIRINPGPYEFRLLDVIGYDQVGPVPVMPVYPANPSSPGLTRL
ncbi:MAG: NF038122 family metalloprotease [Armatimonadetes bacterium]|nr:NF038122 family metalloprotease [Armatimonadota bacterium]